MRVVSLHISMNWKLSMSSPILKWQIPSRIPSMRPEFIEIAFEHPRIFEMERCYRVINLETRQFYDAYITELEIVLCAACEGDPEAYDMHICGIDNRETFHDTRADDFAREQMDRAEREDSHRCTDECLIVPNGEDSWIMHDNRPQENWHVHYGHGCCQ